MTCVVMPQVTAHSDQPAMAGKESLESLLKKVDLAGKRVFVRVDFNVPQDKNGNVTDDTRIRAALPTIKFLKEKGAKVILASHLGRPKGVTESLRMAPVAAKLTELLGSEVQVATDCVGEEVEKQVESMQNGDVLLLENVRFYKEEEKNDPEFAKKLARLADVYVNDAFGTAHRAHASTAGIAEHVPHKCVGFLMQKELDYLVLDNAQRPLAAIIGGAKVSSKLPVIEALLNKVDKLLLGGGLAYTFLKSKGYSIGNSLVEEDMVELAGKLLKQADEKGVTLLLPVDVVCADKFDNDAKTQVVKVEEGVPDGWQGLDIGPDSIALFEQELADCKTIIWNGPMGVFEMSNFAAGTLAIAKILAKLTSQGATTIVGGGDSVAAIEQMHYSDQVSHVSTGGGATLELLAGETLPGVAAIPNASS